MKFKQYLEQIKLFETERKIYAKNIPEKKLNLYQLFQKALQKMHIKLLREMFALLLTIKMD
jgi:hypothetical protein